MRKATESDEITQQDKRVERDDGFDWLINY